MKSVGSPIQLIESLGAGVFVRRGNSEARLQANDFHRAYAEPVMIWFNPHGYREETIDEVLAVAKKLYSVRRFRFPAVRVPVSTLAKLRSEFPDAEVEGIKQ